MIGSGQSIKRDIEHVLKELGYKDLDEIYSDSDASDHREEDT